jgi:hypothetical protein
MRIHKLLFSSCLSVRPSVRLSVWRINKKMCGESIPYTHLSPNPHLSPYALSPYPHFSSYPLPPYLFLPLPYRTICTPILFSFLNQIGEKVFLEIFTAYIIDLYTLFLKKLFSINRSVTYMKNQFHSVQSVKKFRMFFH